MTPGSDILMPTGYFLPAQVAWINDDARCKLWDKSRRIGATYAESYRAVRKRNLSNEKRDYWFSSADESAACEFAQYCRRWCELFEVVTHQYTQELEDENHFRYTNYVIEFPNGSRINCMSSNPRRFRSKGGDVCLDEFDWHDDPGGMWDAASPVTTWGYEICILTTRNAEGSLFDKFVHQARRRQRGEPDPTGEVSLPWSYHYTPITVAVEQGLAEKIYKIDHVDPAARERFTRECRARCRSEDAFGREYMCIPSSAASTLIPYDLYQACEAECLSPLVPAAEDRRMYYMGVDIGREKDLTIFWIAEGVGDVLVARQVIRMEKAPYQAQLDQGNLLLANTNIQRACVDATGMGDPLAEFWQNRFGAYRVEKVKFTSQTKEHMASLVHGRFQDRRIRVPRDMTIRESFHRVKKVVTAAGNVRYDAARTDAGHSDEFWGCALCCEAAHVIQVPPEIICLTGDA